MLQAKQRISVVDFPIWFADRFELELTRGLKGLNALPGMIVVREHVSDDIENQYIVIDKEHAASHETFNAGGFSGVPVQGLAAIRPLEPAEVTNFGRLRVHGTTTRLNT